MTLYVLVMIWLSAQTGLPQDWKRMGEPTTADKCVKAQLAQPIERAKDGEIKIYGCVPQSFFDEERL